MPSNCHIAFAPLTHLPISLTPPSIASPSRKVLSHRPTNRRTTRLFKVQSTLAPERSTSTGTSPSCVPTVKSNAVPDLPDWRYVGPPLLSDGKPVACPTIIYLALTATQSLELDPFNQLLTACPLPLDTVRIFSPTLPFHSDTDMQLNEQVFHQWASVYSSGGDLMSTFVRRADKDITHLVHNGYCIDNVVHIAGLSRGGLLAGLLSAKCVYIESCLMFAPVTSLGSLSEMQQLVNDNNEKVRQADLRMPHVIDQLIRIPVRVYMGNMDRRVGTKQAFEFAHLLAETAAKSGVRSPPHEFIMYCSVGKHGHGTPPDVFQAGALFILSQIEDIRNNQRRTKRIDQSSK